MDKGMEESILRPTCDARDQSLALGAAGGVDRTDAAEALRAELCAFEDLINQPLSRDRDEAPQVRDYRHAIYPQFEKVAGSVLALLTSLGGSR